MTWKDGRVYVGDFSSDQMNGQGKLLKVDGTTYEGLTKYYIVR